MFRTNFRVALSWALKQPLYYAVKMFGLALGVLSVALLIAYVDFVSEYDSHVPNRDQVYRLVGEYVSRENGARVRYHFGSNAWIEPFKQEYSSIYDDMGVLVGRNGVLAYESRVFDQEYYFADQGALQLFGITLTEGSLPDALTGPNKILLSESAALKYFGTAQGILGKALLLDDTYYLGVSGVFRDLPKQTNFPMDAIISYETTERVLSEATLRNQLWIMFNRHTVYVRFDDPRKARAVDADLHDFAYRRSPEQDLPILERNQFTLRLQPISNIYLDPLTGNTNGDDYTRRNTYLGIWILSLLIIVGACVNYVSLTLGQLQLRMKELGLRTVYGATKPALIGQLVAESLIVSGPALLLSLLLLYIFVPVFATVVAVPMEFSDVLTLSTWGGVALGIFLVCAVVSAAPVLFSRQDSLKTRLVSAKNRRLRLRAASTVIFFQFALSTVSALIVLGIYLQVTLLRNADNGFNPENLIAADIRYEGANVSADGFDALKRELGSITGVEALAAMSVVPPQTGSFTNWTRIADGQPVEHTVSHIRVDPDFLSTWRIPLIAGRNFSLDFPSELITADNIPKRTFGILLTRAGTKRFGFLRPEDAVGHSFRYSRDTSAATYIVIGVIEDFMFSPIESDVSSIAILQGTDEPLRSLAIRLREDAGQKAIEDVRVVWSRLLPGVPFNINFMDRVVSAAIEAKTQSLSLTASMATLVFFCTAIIGIYAQASFICDSNAKSMAIRKVLGSSRATILAYLLKQFSLPVIASFTLAVPAAMYFIMEFYRSFQDTPGFPVTYYALCLAGITLLALVTVFSHCWRAAARHPMSTLRHE